MLETATDWWRGRLVQLHVVLLGAGSDAFLDRYQQTKSGLRYVLAK